MVKAHPEPLVGMELHPERLSEAYADFARDRYAKMTVRPAGATPRVLPDEADVLLFLFLGSTGDVRPSLPRGMSISHVYQFLNAPAFQTRLGSGSADESFRRLFATWLEKERYVTIWRRGLDLAARHKIRECAPMLVRIAGDSGALATVRATALLGIGRVGTREDFKRLAPLMKSETQICLTAINGQRASVQMRDVALAASIMLAGQDTTDFGFERHPPAGVTSASYIYYAFTSDEKRAATHEKWQKWAAANLKK